MQAIVESMNKKIIEIMGRVYLYNGGRLLKTICYICIHYGNVPGLNGNMILLIHYFLNTMALIFVINIYFK